MPFAGSADDARAAVSSLLRLELREGDELIVADNSGTVRATPGVTVVTALAERSPAHARNAGAAHALGDFILFLDADCIPGEGLLDAYFATPVEPAVGALAGEVVPAAGGATIAARYGAARSFLGQEAHLAHPYRPRAAAANLMVRRAAFEQLGGFYEGLRAAEDTDFSWRLQEAGWRLEIRPEARVEHRYRATLAELRRQWRGYAAGRAWLARRYEGFTPEPALARASRRAWRRARDHRRSATPHGPAVPRGPAPRDPRFLAIDALLAADELAGFILSNRPPRLPEPAPPEIRVVLVADRFPVPGDPPVALDGARVEAAARPDWASVEVSHRIGIDYREDDGAAGRAMALAHIAIRHPLRCLVDLLGRRPGEPPLAALAPAAVRFSRDRDARVQAIGGDSAQSVARRLIALVGSRKS